MIKSLTLQNVLSFGETPQTLELQKLNIFIGANGSGKSNVIDIIEVIKNIQDRPELIIRKLGGIKNWIWKNDEEKNTRTAIINCNYNFEYTLSVKIYFNNFEFEIGSTKKDTSSDNLEFVEFELDLITMRIYRDWTFGRKTIMREPQDTEEFKDHLHENFSNLNVILAQICLNPITKAKLLTALQQVNPDFEDLRFSHPSGYIELFLQDGKMMIPAKRLSDGTLRYLCLLAILLNPNPPSVICIEEPELGFHPDLIVSLADLIKEASQRSQIIITTHSDILIDCFSDTPEAVVVFEKDEGVTTFSRLKKEEIKLWLKDYGLGKLWKQGHFGGLRW